MTNVSVTPELRPQTSIIGQRWRNVVTRQTKLVIGDDGVTCQLEGVDRRIQDVAKSTMVTSDVWERQQ